MPSHSPAELYIEELKHLYKAEQQVLKVLPNMIAATRHDALKHAFETHRQQTEGHIDRLARVVGRLGETLQEETVTGALLSTLTTRSINADADDTARSRV